MSLQDGLADALKKFDNKSTLGGLMGAPVAPVQQHLSAEEQAFLDEMQFVQINDFATFLNSLIERCFLNCVTSMNEKTLLKQEVRCINVCTDKYFKAYQRMGMRIMENSQMRTPEPAGSSPS